METTHDVFNCECHETCSLCAESFQVEYLQPLVVKGPEGTDEWENVCPWCRAGL